MSGVTRETVQQEVRDWLQDNWDPQLSLQAWRERLVDAGWAVPSWSRKWFGRDLPDFQAFEAFRPQLQRPSEIHD